MSSEHLAKEAARLKSDPIFDKALSDIRADALNALVGVDADNYTAVVRLQQKVVVIDEIRTCLDRYILQGQQDPVDGASSYA